MQETLEALDFLLGVVELANFLPHFRPIDNQVTNDARS